MYYCIDYSQETKSRRLPYLPSWEVSITQGRTLHPSRNSKRILAPLFSGSKFRRKTYANSCFLKPEIPFKRVWAKTYVNAIMFILKKNVYTSFRLKKKKSYLLILHRAAKIFKNITHTALAPHIEPLNGFLPHFK